jgi:hypothetical protein
MDFALQVAYLALKEEARKLWVRKRVTELRANLRVFESGSLESGEWSDGDIFKYLYLECDATRTVWKTLEERT